MSNKIAKVDQLPLGHQAFVCLVDQRNFQTLLGALHRLRVGSGADAGFLRHGLRQCPISSSIDHFVLGARNRTEHVTEIERRIPQVAVVAQR
ncbi:hypothetical protein SDC9_63971 [bioreactor metagenome]|uniref:Uncharacterized protein n=1 Tax=bioreactor metagenome TaxID=1076179 RepID=A0A644XN56_9ZZZZ